MRLSTTALVLGTLAAGTVSAASIAHDSMFGKRHNHAARHAEIMKKSSEAVEAEKRDSAISGLLSSVGSARLTQLGSKLGLNPTTSQGLNPWIGTGGQFTNEFINQSGEDLVLAIWGPSGSWVNTIQPQVTVSIPHNASQTVSFPWGWSGAWSPVYADTKMVWGQISETWGEGTFAEKYSTVDVSREVNMNGRPMKIVTPQCVSDMETCVFKCGNGEASCMYGYQLMNCAKGSQPGAGAGTFEGAASGGCTDMGSSASLTTYLG